MEQNERDEAIRMLLAQQAELNEKLGRLGIKQGEKRDTKAPDGGAMSDAHKFLNVKHAKTIRVRYKNVKGSDEAIIRADLFDPKLHEPLEPVRTPRAIPTASAGRQPRTLGHEVQVSAHTRDELLTMTIPNLRTLPEVQTGMEANAIPEKKGALVDAILKVREEATAE